MTAADGGRQVFVGDVHGCLDELDELLGTVGLGAGDRVFLVGDLVERGPASVGVIRRAAELIERYPGSGVTMGNHEEKILRDRERGRELPAWAAEASDDDWRFLERMPLLLRPAPGVLMVHGGLFPRFFEHHGTIGEVPADWRTSREKRVERMRRFLRIVFIDERGDMVPREATHTAFGHWADHYDGREGFVFFGHHAQRTEQPRRSEHALCIDTSCCFGGRLTAAVLEPGVAPADAAIVSVPARRAYAERDPSIR